MLVYDNKRSSVRRILTVNCTEHVSSCSIHSVCASQERRQYRDMHKFGVSPFCFATCGSQASLSALMKSLCCRSCTKVAFSLISRLFVLRSELKSQVSWQRARGIHIFRFIKGSGARRTKSPHGKVPMAAEHSHLDMFRGRVWLSALPAALVKVDDTPSPLPRCSAKNALSAAVTRSPPGLRCLVL